MGPCGPKFRPVLDNFVRSMLSQISSAVRGGFAGPNRGQGNSIPDGLLSPGGLLAGAPWGCDQLSELVPPGGLSELVTSLRRAHGADHLPEVGTKALSNTALPGQP